MVIRSHDVYLDHQIWCHIVVDGARMSHDHSIGAFNHSIVEQTERGNVSEDLNQE